METQNHLHKPHITSGGRAGHREGPSSLWALLWLGGGPADSIRAGQCTSPPKNGGPFCSQGIRACQVPARCPDQPRVGRRAGQGAAARGAGTRPRQARRAGQPTARPAVALSGAVLCRPRGSFVPAAASGAGAAPSAPAVPQPPLPSPRAQTRVRGALAGATDARKPAPRWGTGTQAAPSGEGPQVAGRGQHHGLHTAHAAVSRGAPGPPHAPTGAPGPGAPCTSPLHSTRPCSGQC